MARVVIGVETPEFAFDGPYSIHVDYKDKNDVSFTKWHFCLQNKQKIKLPPNKHKMHVFVYYHYYSPHCN